MRRKGLKKLIKEKFNIVQVKGDGNCLANALSLALTTT